MMRFLPEELQQMLEGAAMLHQVDPADEPLLSLVAKGHTMEGMAARLGVTTRTIEYRLARLRRVIGVGSTAELAAIVAQAGF